MANAFLLKPLRTLREACRDTSAAHPELITGDCDSCLHDELCAISEQTRCGRLGNVVKMKPRNKAVRG
jgi:hypothetical protein